MIHLLLATLLATATPPPTPEQCFAGAEQKYNDDIANNASAKWFQMDYEAFSDCADISQKHKNWQVYYASTVGAMYSQVRLAFITDKECTHLAIAKDLGDEADAISSTQPPDPQWEQGFQELETFVQEKLKDDCGVTVKS